jgi:hypothetical protein
MQLDQRADDGACGGHRRGGDLFVEIEQIHERIRWFFPTAALRGRLNLSLNAARK